MEFELHKNDLTRMILSLLIDLGLFDSACVLSLESGITERDVHHGLIFLYKLVLLGRWKDVMDYLDPFKNIVSDFSKVEFEIRKQWFLELLACKTGDILVHVRGFPKAGNSQNDGTGTNTEDDGIDMASIVEVLKSIEACCSANEFAKMCTTLGLRCLSDSQDPEIATWTVSKGRLRCCRKIIATLSVFLPNLILQSSRDIHSDHVPGLTELLDASEETTDALEGFLRTLALGLSSQISLDTQTLTSHQAPVRIVWEEDRLQPAEGNWAFHDPETAPSMVLTGHQGSGISVHPQPPGSAQETSKKLNPAVAILTNGSSQTGVVYGEGGKGLLVRGRDGSNGHGGPSTTQQTPRGGEDSEHAHLTPSSTHSGAQQPRSGGVGSSSRLEGVGGHRSADRLSRQPTQLFPQPAANTARGGGGSRLSGAGRWSTADDVTRAPSPQLMYQNPSPIRALAVLGIGETEEGLGTLVAIGSNDRTLRLLDIPLASVSTGAIKTRVVKEWPELHKGSIFALDVYRQGTTNDVTGLLATASNDKTLRLTRFDLNSEEKIGSVSNTNISTLLKGHTGTVRSIKFQWSRESAANVSPLMASGGAGDCAVRIWDIDKGACVSSYLQPIDYGAAAPVHGLCWLSNSHLVASSCENGRLFVWDSRSQKLAWTLSLALKASTTGSGRLEGLSCLSSVNKLGDELLVTGGDAGMVSVVSSRQQSVLLREKLHNDEVRAIDILSFQQGTGAASATNTGRDTILLATASSDLTGGVWELSSGAGLDAPISTKHSTCNQKAQLKGHTDKLLSATFIKTDVRFGTPSMSEGIITTGADGNVFFWS